MDKNYVHSVKWHTAGSGEKYEEGIGFDGSAVDGFAPLEQSDMLAFPDPETFQILPWSTVGGAARMFCDIKTPRGESFGGDTRACLSRAFDEAEKKGYFYMVGPEIEYFNFWGQYQGE